ncbi:acyltransferase [Mesonia sp. K4-1]|uniref:acyltransferase n=1 Tax=Mesonia sp. K4-1 TaxID=2602760 RepID=UPI0011C834FB|nr:acyltransferase [Mesonia sp. K4-1]TXK77874.1 acyltransferase [Mesonia sp. K4-1]
MKYRFRIVQIFRKIFLFIYFKINPIGCSRLMGVRIGQNCKIYGNSPNMWGTEPFLITIGDNVFITDGCKFINHDGGTLVLRKKDQTLEYTAPINVGNNVYLGMETMIMPNVNIGNNVIIGARSIVTKNIEDNLVVAGIPAKKIKSIDQYYGDLQNKSLGIGHLGRGEKETELKKLFIK